MAKGARRGLAVVVGAGLLQFASAGCQPGGDQADSSASGKGGASGGVTGAAGVSATGGASGAGGVSSAAGTTGTAGVAGTSATAGTTGAAGTSATAGTTGAAGTSATAGTTGAAGTSAPGGAGGVAGTSGIGGAAGAAGRGGTGGGGGGAAGTGGRAGTGGGTGTGGRGGTGGTGSGGTGSTITGPVLVSTINLRGASGCPGMRLGDINGDGRMEIVVGQPVDQNSLDSYTPQRVAAVTAFDLKGNQLWQYGTPNSFHVASSDIPIQVYDMDGDGKAEIFANMSDTEMTVLDGTGKLLRKIPLPTKGSNDSIAFTNLRGTAYPQDIIVKTRYSQFWAITGVASGATPAGTVLWTHQKGPATGFSDLSTGHYPLVYDWNGDGKDEVMGGYDFMNSAGQTQWSVTTLKLHADSLVTGDMDGNPSNGKEIVVCGDVAAAFDWKTGTRLWQDNHTTEVQQVGMGDYRPDIAGLEVVLLDRLRTDALGLKSNNILVDRRDAVIWQENRPYNSGWLTVTENLNNWDGKGSDNIFSWRRGTGGAYLYDGSMNTVASFAYPGGKEQNFALHADLCGDAREEVIVYDDTTAWIYANGGCDLNAAPSQPGLPQQYHLYNWSIYTGWITPDQKFFTPGTPR